MSKLSPAKSETDDGGAAPGSAGAPPVTDWASGDVVGLSAEYVDWTTGAPVPFHGRLEICDVNSQAGSPWPAAQANPATSPTRGPRPGGPEEPEAQPRGRWKKAGESPTLRKLFQSTEPTEEEHQQHLDLDEDTRTIQRGFEKMTGVKASGVLDNEEMIAAEEVELLLWRQNHKYPNLLYVVDNMTFETVMGAVILANCLTIALQTDNPEGVLELALAENVFTFIFLSEVCLRSLVYGFRAYYLSYFYNFCDLTLVLVTGVLVTWILEPLDVSDGFFRNLQVLRALRLIRAARLVKSLPAFQSMWLLIQGLRDATSMVLWASAVIVFFLYIAALFATVVIGQSDAFDDTPGGREAKAYFSDVTSSMITLFQIMLLDGAFGIIRLVMDVKPSVWVFFTPFILTSSFVLMNVIRAVLCNNALESAKEDAEQRAHARDREKRRIVESLKDALHLVLGEEGVLWKFQLVEALSDPLMAVKLKELGVSAEDCEDLFDILDPERGGSVNLDDFADGLPRLSGMAKAKDLFFCLNKLGYAQLRMRGLKDQVSNHQSRFTELYGNLRTILDEVTLLNEMLALRGPVPEHLMVRVMEKTRQIPETVFYSEIPDGDTTVPDEMDAPALCLTSRESGRLVQVPQSIQSAQRDARTEARMRDAFNSEEQVDWAAQCAAWVNVKYCCILEAFRALGIELEQTKTQEELGQHLLSFGIPAPDARRVFKALEVRPETALDCRQLCHMLALEGRHSVDPVVVSAKFKILKWTFRAMDADRSQSLDEDEFVKALVMRGCQEEDARQAFQLAAASMPTLSLLEFCRALSLTEMAASAESFQKVKMQLMKLAFYSVVGVGQHDLTATQFEGFMIAMGVQREVASRAFRIFDLNRDGTLHVDEFFTIAASGGVPCRPDASEHQRQLEVEAFRLVLHAMLRTAFYKMDVNGDQTLSPDEFADALGPAMISRDDALAAFTQMDTDHNGRLTANELSSGVMKDELVLEAPTALKVKFAVYRAAYALLDRNHRDQVDLNEFCAVVGSAGTVPLDVEATFRFFDIDSDGVLSFSEFCSAMAMVKSSPSIMRAKYAFVVTVFQAMKTSPGDTYVDEVAFGRALSRHGCTVQEAQDFFHLADFKRDRKLDVNELCDALGVESLPFQDPRSFMRLKFALCRACFETGKNKIGVTAADTFVSTLVRFGASVDAARIVFEAVWGADALQAGVEEFCMVFAADGETIIPRTKQAQEAWKIVRVALFARIFDVLDVNHSKSLQLYEWKEALQWRGLSEGDIVNSFSWMDRKHQGYITKAELETALSTASNAG